MSVGLSIALVCSIGVMLLYLPWQIHLRWRKFWLGPLAIQVRIDSPGRCWTYTCKQRSQFVQTLQQWIWPLQARSPSNTLRQSHRKLRFIAALSPAVKVSAWTSLTQFGFDDPSLTGECLGLLAAMPLPLQQSIAITFEREGCQTKGQLSLTVKPIALGWRVLSTRFQNRWV